MENFFIELMNRLKRNEKDMLIKQSGSTKNSKNEKVRSGQSYLYKKHGMESEVIEIRFHKKVIGSYLNQSLYETMKRYPYFNTKVIEKDGDFYIVQNTNSLVARKTKTLPKLGHISCGYHLIDVTYFDYSIYISFHHALCDGRGIKPFIETLIYYYCKLKYKNNEKIEGIRLANDPLLEGETIDPFMREYDYDDTKDFISLSRDAFDIPENVPIDSIINFRYEVKIPHNEFMKACKENNATPVILLALLMNKGIANLYPDYDKPINANIATDMREALDANNTFKNCVKSMILPYSREFSNLTLREQATEYRELLKRQRDRDYCRREANNMLGLFNRLDSLTSFEEKQKIMSFFEGMLLKTYVISYLGQFILGSNEKHIESIHLYNSGATGLGINMISSGEYFTLDFKQTFESDKYVEAFIHELDNLGINYNKSNKIEFFTPSDGVIKRKNID